MLKGNGLKRINDILTWDKVSTRANYDNTVLSFQRGYIALFQVRYLDLNRSMTMLIVGALVVSVLRFCCKQYPFTSHQVCHALLPAPDWTDMPCSALYMVFMEHFDSVAEKVQKCMEAALNDDKMFSDGSPASKIGGAQVFGSLVVVLLQYVEQRPMSLE